MKRILKKRILPLLCVGLLLCPHTIVYATAGDIESTIAQTEESEPSAEMLSSAETTLPTAETQPPTAEGLLPETKTEKPEEESMPDVMPPPKQNSKEKTQTAPHTESGASPQEEPQ